MPTTTLGRAASTWRVHKATAQDQSQRHAHRHGAGQSLARRTARTVWKSLTASRGSDGTTCAWRAPGRHERREHPLHLLPCRGSAAGWCCAPQQSRRLKALGLHRLAADALEVHRRLVLGVRSTTTSGKRARHAAHEDRAARRTWFRRARISRAPMASPDGSPAIRKTVGGVARRLARRRQMRGKAPGISAFHQKQKNVG
eukprot:scaffold5378_cov107-Isochrysis_galbana.AAC.2